MQVETSIIPPKARMVTEYKKHAYHYDWITRNAYLDDWITDEDGDKLRWHDRETDKLKKVLDALYPGWEKDLP